jgi:hypothetical protein
MVREGGRYRQPMIVLLMVTKNEADLLRLNIEHHLAWGIDHVAVADNMSNDETPDVIREFGDQVSTVRFDDYVNWRRPIRGVMLASIKERFGTVDWAGVSDSDELWYVDGTDMRTVLAEVPDDIVAANFDQKLFLPTAFDDLDLPVHARREYCSPGHGPLHSGYREGKTFYRGDWLTAVDDEHWCRTVPHKKWRHEVAAVHHYAFTDEDNFVMKVSRFRAWQTAKRRRAAAVGDLFRRIVRKPAPPPQSPQSEPFRAIWWDVYARGGESALREYYRTQYTLSPAEVQRALDADELVHDSALAVYTRDRLGVGATSASEGDDTR